MEAEGQNIHKLRFDGRGIDLFKIYFMNMLMTVVTVGIYSFWARVKVTAYLYRHTELMGERFEYHATGLERFLGFLKALLFVIPVIILYLLLELLLLAFLEKETIAMLLGAVVYLLLLPSIPFLLVGKERYRLGRSSWYNIRFRFTGRGFELLRLLLISISLTLITFGFYFPWAQVRIREFFIENSFYGNLGMKYTGRGKDLFFLYLKGFALTLITLGVYGFWMNASIYRYHINSVQTVDGLRFHNELKGWDLMKNTILTVFLIPFTLGLAMPWMIIRFQRIYLETTYIEGDLDLKSVIGRTDESANAIADGFSDITDALDTLGEFLGG